MVQKLVFGAFSFTPPGTTDGIEPWVTDGTAEGTFLLRDINVGSSGSTPTSFFSVNGKVVFYATTPANGSELWVTDGTTDGTTLLADINPGSGSAGINANTFTLLGNKLLFTANSPATGIELWVTDGTSAGTQLLRDIVPGAGNGVVQSKPLAVLGNTAIFAADGDVWSTDGTPAGTVKVFDFVVTGGQPSSVVADSFQQAGGLVYFSATQAQRAGLWVTDGTASGTRQISDLGPNDGTSFAAPIGTLGSSTFFVAQLNPSVGTTLGAELYVSTGTGLELFRDFVPGFATGHVNPDPNRVAIAGDQLFFTREIPAVDNPTELWVIDGATGTTQLLQTFTNITGPKFSVFGDSVVFTATTTVGGVQSAFAPWISDGTVAGTQQLLAGNPTASGSNADAGNYIPFAGKLFFTANGGASTGKELWVTDGTPAGTALFRDIFPGASASSPSDFRVVGDKLFFQATTAGGREYWVTDGTPAGTVQVKDIAIGSLGSVLPAGAFGSAVLGDAAPAAPTYAITGTPTTDEGGQLIFTVTRDIGTAAGAVALALGGTATGGADYAAPGLTVSFAAGETVKTVTIATLPDAITEGDETVIVTLGSVTGGGTVSAANGTATGTITNVTPPPVDTVAPTVTINQAVTQVDPTSGTSIVFDVTFSEAVTGFQTGDVALSGTAGATSAVVSGSGANYSVTVTGMTGPGEVIATIAAGVAIDAAGNASLASTSTDNTVTVASNPVTAVADLYATPSGQTLVVSAADGVLANDTAPDGGAVVLGLLNGGNLVGGTLFTGSGGLVSIAPDGSLNYVPAAGFRGQETVTYRMRDADGSFADATVTFDVVNNAPVASTDTYFVRPGSEADFPDFLGLLSNDRDPDRDPLIITGFDTDSLRGTLTPFLDGSFRYTAPVGFTGVETFTYTVSDRRGGTDTATVTLYVTNAPPEALDDGFDIRPGQNFLVSAGSGLLENDRDPDGDLLTVDLIGIVSVRGDLRVRADGSYSYTAPEGFVGVETFTYRIVDGFGGSDTGTVTINVVNAAPVAVDNGFDIRPGQTFLVSAESGLLENDRDPDGDLLTVDLIGIVSVRGDLRVRADGSYSYTAPEGFVGVETFTYRIVDGFGGSDTGTVTINVVNGAPVALDDVYATRPGQTLNVEPGFGVVVNDDDPDGDIFFLTERGGASNGEVSLSSDGGFTYTPNPGFTGTDTFDYTISDRFGGSDTGTVTINVVNYAPVAVDDVYTARPGQEISVGVMSGLFANDSDPDSDGFFLTGLGAPASGGAVSLASDGSFTYTPGAGFTGIDTFSYTISDRFGGSDTGTVTINVVNTAPVAVDDSTTTAEGAAVRIAVLGNDRDPDGDVLVLDAAQMITGGTVTRDGDAFVFTPSAGFAGQGGFDYTVSDGFGGTDTARVNVTVNETTPDPILRLGTPGNDRLSGTNADEIIDSLGGRTDVLAGGGGADTFRFSATANGVRETRTVTDFGSDDVLDLGTANVASWRQLGGDVFLYLDLDRDLIILKDVLGYDGDWFV